MDLPSSPTTTATSSVCDSCGWHRQSPAEESQLQDADPGHVPSHRRNALKTHPGGCSSSVFPWAFAAVSSTSCHTSSAEAAMDLTSSPTTTATSSVCDSCGWHRQSPAEESQLQD